MAFTAGEAEYVRKRLLLWLKPERVTTPIFTLPGVSRIHREPLGVVLIIGERWCRSADGLSLSSAYPDGGAHERQRRRLRTP